jgi:diguanylate cyclase (GGDEF)-like protein/putative nucleotidyltransferase with HDIG domain
MNGIIGQSKEIFVIRHDNTIREAAGKMLFHKVGCLIVNDPEGKFIGLVTERDIAHSVAKYTGDLNKTTVAEIMTRDIVSCPPGTATSRAREIMAANRIRHLPIVEHGIIVGILSARDLMGRQLLEDRAAAEEVAMLANCLKSIDLNEAAETIVKEVPGLFEAENCVLCLFKEDSDAGSPEVMSRNRCICQQNDLEQPVSGPVPVDTKPGQNVLRRINWIDLPDSSLGDGFYHDTISEHCEKLDAHPPRLVIPLEVCLPKETAGDGTDKHLYGYLCMCGLSAAAASNRELTSYKARLAREILTSHLTNAALYQQARICSITDALTGVGSRNLLEDKLEAECARAKRYKRPFSVAIIDLDHFKTINDVLGHAAGDEAIKKLADCMRTEKRTSDILARFGGDEFVILMPETKAEDSTVLLERLRVLVHEIKLGENMSLSMSCGIAQYTVDTDSSPRDVMRRADIALYEAKSAGRNCVKTWDKAMSKALDAADIELEKIRKLQQRLAGMSEKAEKMFMQSIWGLVQALEAKDPYAARHSENVTYYAVCIAEVMKLGPKHIDVIRRAAMIHDIGKIGIPDAIISKPGSLTPHERNIVEQHPLIAARILKKMSFLEQEMEIVRHHHEKWNGQGYPDSLPKTSIPLGARILAVADTFEALTANRSYRRCRPVSEAIKILCDSSGYEFDPEIVKSMVAWLEQVAKNLGKPLDRITTDDLLDSQQPAAAPELISAGSSKP